MENPFAGLVGTSACDTNSVVTSITPVVEDVFLFTLNKEKQGKLLYLDEIAMSLSSEEFNVDILEHALFERILLTNSVCETEKKKLAMEPTENSRVILYLYGCYKRNECYKDATLKSKIGGFIMRNIVTALKQPELYEGQDLCAQIYGIQRDMEPEAFNFLLQIIKSFQKDEDGVAGMKEPFTLLLKLVHIDVAKSTPITFPHFVFNILNLYATQEELALILLEYNQVKQPSVGVYYSNTLFGAIFCVSVMPKTGVDKFDFFQDGIDQASVSRLEGILWASSNRIAQDVHGLVLNLLKISPTVKAQTLIWIGECLKANEDRGKLWNSHAPHLNLPNTNTVSDGFMINLGILLVKLCQPFCANIKDGKILKVDPTYCAVPVEECISKGVHLPNMSKETCLVPTPETGESRCTASTFSFLTECFFMAHRTFDIGFRVLSDKLLQLNQEMGSIERAYQDALAQSSGSSEVLDNIKERLQSELSKYLSTKCGMSEPNFLDALFNLFSASAYWLNNVAINILYTTSFSPLKEHTVTFPLSDKIPDTLKCIPEFVIENIVCFLIFLRRFSPRTFEEQGYERLQPILTFILVYMGSSGYTRNPHLRARLAEALEALLPFHKDQPTGLNTLGGAQRERLFKEHEHRKEIVAILLDVFVSIEMTGQNVQFEQKFNYRRPMYMIMDYLWEMQEYQQYFRQLAQQAESNMEAVQPPIFLRFINLLINDAIFLLDESLSNMAKLKEMETARANGEWDRLSVQERTQNMGSIQHIGMIARFDNILGRDTIRTLDRLTSCITIVFTHNTMVDRVAAMLNYFLLKLVGPDKKNFKVKDHKEYSFDPAATVMDICKIYVNLKECDAFCLAVSQDGRSYSPQLFTLAEDVLVRIGGGQLVGELQEVARKVSIKSDEYKTSEEAMAEAPEHFLDPIMSTLMLDPVILPSSKQIVDRSTIARHLLSDQTDPFNRAPLSMDLVIPHTELATEIRQWLDERTSKS